MKIFKKEIYFLKIPFFITKPSLNNDFWSHVYGLFSAVGLGITIYFTYKSYNNINNEDIKIVIETLTVTIAITMLTFIFVSAYYVTTITKNKRYKSDFKALENEIKNQLLTNTYLTECIHNITHYYRNSIDTLSKGILLNPDKVGKEEKMNIVRKMDNFFVILTSSLQNYFSFTTGDNCSVTIKIVSEDSNYVRTFFRDPINFNRRRKAYPEENYLISKNYALNLIMDEQYVNTYFYDDNLKVLEKVKSISYENSNSNWKDFYNATIVVPISMITAKNRRNVVGFICVDNKIGKLSNHESKELLLGIGDLAYNLLVEYKKYININYGEIKENERVKTFRMGS